MLARILTTIIAVLVLTVAMVAAQTPAPQGCADFKEFDPAIKELDGETPAFSATLPTGAGLVIYVNDAARTFTFVLVPRGHPEWRCPMGIYGTDWTFIEPGQGT